MELGQRLKQARLEAGLSQRQLCGEEITRNMLSQIENGSARPSMDTLRYLASRLGKSVSYFLEENAASVNQSRMAAARAEFTAGEAEKALEALREYHSPDPVFDQEYYLLRCLVLLCQAEQEDDPVRARQLLDAAKADGCRTVYYTPEQERRRLLCLARISPDDRNAILSALPCDDRELLMRAQAALDANDISGAVCLLDAARDHSAPQWLLLRGDATLAGGDPDGACGWYLQAESSAPRLAYARLEQLYLQQENYKMAYEYACKQR